MSSDKDSKTQNKVHHVETRDQLNNYLNQEGLVVLDFSAEWCGPCKRIAPDFEKLAKTTESVTFLHVDIDELEDVASEMGVSSVPTFFFYKGGKKVGTVSGANLAMIKETISKNL
jgi:thioredoxin